MTTALLDTCVLVPSRARDVLLEIAGAGVYLPLWSSEILAELDRTLRLLLAKRGAAPEEADAYLTRLFRQMRITFPDASSPNGRNSCRRSSCPIPVTGT